MRLILPSQMEKGMVLAQDIYLFETDSIPFVTTGTILNEQTIHKISQQNVSTVYIMDEKEKEQLFPRSLEKSPPALDVALRNEALENLEDLFNLATSSEMDSHSSTQAIEHLDSVVNQMVNSIRSTSPGALVNINDLRSYDDYTFHHSLSVAVLSIAIGQYLNLSGDELNRLGVCAMMHDIGKTAIPVELIRKPSRLDDNEFTLIKTHSSAGFTYLTQSDIGNEELWRGVLYHHEKIDGTGYPHGIKGDEIPLWSRIISVADVYDALTSNRPYRTPMEAADAIEYIMGGIGTSFDYDIVAALVKKIDLYPVGEHIELSNGMRAVVLDNQNQMRPIVRVQGTNDIIDLYSDRSTLNVVIKRVLPLSERSLIV